MNKPDFNQIWQKEIKPIMEGMQEQKNTARRQQGWLIFSLLILVGIPGIVGEGAISWQVGALIFVPLMLLSVWRIHALKNTYSQDFKSQIFTVLQKYTDFSWDIYLSTEDDKNSLRDQARAEFKDSNIATGYDDVLVENVLSAEYEGVNMYGAELEATETNHMSDHAKRVTVFDGFFVTIPVNDRFSGQTYILTEQDDLWGNAGVGPSSLMGDTLDESELEWGEFEDVFVIKTDSPQEAREVFTPDFMQVFYDWYKKHKKTLRVAFVGGQIYIGIRSDISFEPDMYGDINDQKENVEGMFDLLLLMESLVKHISYHHR